MNTKNILIVLAVIAIIYLLMQGKIIDYAKRLTTAANPFNLGNTIRMSGNADGNSGGAIQVETPTAPNVIINGNGGDGYYDVDTQGGNDMGGAIEVNP